MCCVYLNHCLLCEFLSGNTQYMLVLLCVLIIQLTQQTSIVKVCVCVCVYYSLESEMVFMCVV